MTERKAPRVEFESWVDAQIRDATERGEFDNLAGAGRPLPGAGIEDDEAWWLRGFLRRERIDTDAVLPAPLRLRKEIDDLPAAVRGLACEREVREVVDRLNARVRESWREPSGPGMHVRLVNPDRVVERWRAERAAAEAAAEAAAAEVDAAGSDEAAGHARVGSRRWPWRRRR